MLYQSIESDLSMLRMTTKNLFALTAIALSCVSFSAYADTHATAAKKAPATKHAAKHTAAAESKDSKVELKDNLPVTEEEVATVNVLGEICPKILGKNPNFDKGYRLALADMLPGVTDPVLAIRALQDDPNYQKVLKDARNEAAKATVEDNREVCLELTQYKPGSASN